MKTRTLFILTFLLVGTMSSFGQSKEACKPESCGPAGTKQNEAKAITTLRNDLVKVMDQIVTSDSKLKSIVATVKLEQGSTDEESLDIIFEAALKIRSAIITSIDSKNLISELKEQPERGKSKQELMANTRQQVKLLAMQAQKL